jgi:hypothetical protein
MGSIAMPYRFAHWLILMLIVLTVPAFWRSYLSDLSSSRIELHVHGVTASIWMALLAIQSWAIHNRHRRLHSTLGKASFVLFPFLLVGFGLVEVSWARNLIDGTSEFHNEYGARIGAIDLVAFFGTAFFYYMALRTRRNVELHAGYMIVTVVFLIGPVVQRLLPLVLDMVTGSQVEWSTSNHVRFGIVFTLLLLWAVGHWSAGNTRPLRDAALLTSGQLLLWETLGVWSWWTSVYTGLGAGNPLAIGTVAFLFGIALILAGWREELFGRRGGTGTTA